MIVLACLIINSHISLPHQHWSVHIHCWSKALPGFINWHSLLTFLRGLNGYIYYSLSCPLAQFISILFSSPEYVNPEIVTSVHQVFMRLQPNIHNFRKCRGTIFWCLLGWSRQLDQPTPKTNFEARLVLGAVDGHFICLVQWLQWLQWGVTFSQVVWLIGCWLVSASHKEIHKVRVRLHRYICLWWASERKLGKKPVTKPKKTLEKLREQG
jgi:hypothetical protein